MKRKVSRIEMTEMLLKLDEAKETNLKTISSIEGSLKGYGGQHRDNRIIFKQQIAQLKETMLEQEELYKTIVNQLYQRVNK